VVEHLADSPQARQRHSSSPHIASPWQRRRSLSPPRPRSPSPLPSRRYEPSLSPPPHSAFPSLKISRSIPPPHPTTISTSIPALIRLHLCLPSDLPSTTFTNYLESLSPPFQIYEQKLYTAQRAAMGFIVVEKELWESGEIARRIRRRGETEFGLRGDRRWGIKLSIARDQNFSSISGVWQSDRSGECFELLRKRQKVIIFDRFFTRSYSQVHLVYDNLPFLQSSFVDVLLHRVITTQTTLPSSRITTNLLFRNRLPPLTTPVSSLPLEPSTPLPLLPS